MQTHLCPLSSAIKRQSTTAKHQPVPKRRRSSACAPKPKMYAKDIVCLPHTLSTPVHIPRGKKRGELADIGLIGKISLNTAWNAREVEREVSTVFSSAFGLRDGELLCINIWGKIPSAFLIVSVYYYLIFSFFHVTVICKICTMGHPLIYFCFFW